MKYTVKQGSKYQADIKLNFIERIASNETIEKKFKDAGFVNVKVTGDGKNRVAIGEWPTKDSTADLPDQITSVKII